MLALATGGLGLPKVAANVAKAATEWPDGFRKTFETTFWPAAANQVTHVPWTGCVFWDLIQPSFMFMVGVSMPYSYARRRAQGDSFLGMLGHVLLRSLALILLGIFLSSQGKPQVDFTFMNVLTQIGLGYTFVFLLMNRGAILQVLAIVAILAGYGYAFYKYPVSATAATPPVAAPSETEPSLNDRFAKIRTHWEQDTNFAADVDRKFLNKFPRPEPFVSNAGGYQTLNFIPSIATMLLGLLAGELLRSDRTAKAKLMSLLIGGAVCMAAGLALGYTVCPLVKRIWTPSWTLFSGAITLWILAAFYGVIDVRGWRRWAFPLVVVGMNSILMYMMSQLMRPWVTVNLRTLFGGNTFDLLERRHLQPTGAKPAGDARLLAHLLLALSPEGVPAHLTPCFERIRMTSRAGPHAVGRGSFGLASSCG